MYKQLTKQSGFTLMEVIAVTAISGTLAALSVPMIDSYQTTKAANSAQSAFIESIQIAREAAVSDGQRVSICPSLDGESCSGTWTDGWVVYVGDKDQVFSASNVIHASELGENLELELFSETPELVTSLTFDENGFNQNNFRVTAAFCDADNQLNTLTVERTGRIVDSALHKNYQQEFLNFIHKEKLESNTRCTRA